MKLLALCLLLLSLNAQAGLKKHTPIECDSYEAFIKQIMNCGDNSLALNFANQCADRISAEAKENARELTALMKQYEKGMINGQSQSQENNGKNLRVAIDVLYRQIVDMQRNTARVADYTLAMIDAPGSDSAETSTDCFNSAFDSLSDIVKRMDKEIVNTISARKKALALLKLSGEHHGDLGTMNPVKMTSPPRRPASAPKGPKGKNWNASDVSGTEPKKKPFAH
jgi:hypothetical protein